MPSANIYLCQSSSACEELFLAGMGPVPNTHNTKASDLTVSLSVEISFNQNSVLTSLLTVILRCAHTQTQTKKLTHKDSPLNPCDVMGAGEDIQEVIKNRLFSQEKKEILSHGAVGTCGIHQSILSTFNMLQAIHHVSHDCQDASLFICFTLLFLLFCCFPPHKSRIFREFSSVLNKSGVFYL